MSDALRYNVLVATKLLGYKKDNWNCGVTNETNSTFISPDGGLKLAHELPDLYGDNKHIPMLIDKLLENNIPVTFVGFGLNSVVVNIPTGHNGEVIAESDEQISAALTKAIAKYLETR